MIHPARRLAIAAACAAGLAAAAIDASPVAQSAQQGAQQPQQPAPVFRAATNFVRVDAYPTRDGRIIEGLTARDFEVFEDGKAQTIESVEFIRIEPNTPEALRRDPNTQEEGNRLAADPRNRVFVLYLDHYHGSLYGSHSVRQPIVTMLNRLLTPNDLFGVATALMRPRDLVLGRQTVTIEDQLTRHWTWGLQSGAVALEPEEEGLVRCYGEKVALMVTARAREARTLESLSSWVHHLGALREARKALIVFSRGWELYEPDQNTMMRLLGPDASSRTPMGIGPGGKLSMNPNVPGSADWSWCSAEVSRAYTLDNRRRFRALIDEANRANVAFYPVHVNGLMVGGDHTDVLRTLAENTDGLAVVTNDFAAGLRRIADDVSAYYLLGYYSTNTKFDGNYRWIQVKVASPGARVKARRGYLPPLPSARTVEVAPKAGPPAGVTEALDLLSRLRVSAELYTYGVATPTDLAIVVELPSAQVSTAAWEKGADVQVTLADPAGGAGTPVTARIEPGTRGVLVRVPRPPGAGPFRVSVKATGHDALATDRAEVAVRAAVVIGEPLIFRASSGVRSPLRPVADYQFWRTERVHVEWPAEGPLDRREGRMLGRDGRPLPLPVTVTEREQNGRPVLAADVSLAPLAPGDYVLEIFVVRGKDEARRFIPLRVVR
jgi:VWFA-related protein